MQLEQGPTVGGIGSVKGTHDAEVVHTAGDMGEQVTHRQAALAILAKFPRGTEQRTSLGKGHPRQIVGKGFAAVTIQQRFGVKGVDMTGTALHEQKDNAFRPGPQMSACHRVRGTLFRPQQGGQGEVAKTARGALQETTPPRERN